MTASKRLTEGFDLTEGMDLSAPDFSKPSWKRLWLTYGAFKIQDEFPGVQYSFATKLMEDFLTRLDDNQFPIAWIKKDDILSPFAAIRYRIVEGVPSIGFQIAVSSSEIEPLDLLAESGHKLVPSLLFEQEALAWREQQYKSPSNVLLGGEHDWMANANPIFWWLVRDVDRQSGGQKVTHQWVKGFWASLLMSILVFKFHQSRKACFS